MGQMGNDWPVLITPHRVRQSAGPGGKQQGASDHKHYLDTVSPYRFKDAGALLADFWALVDRVLKERGIL